MLICTIIIFYHMLNGDKWLNEQNHPLELKKNSSPRGLKNIPRGF